MSGLKVNLSKSVLIFIGEVPELYHLAHFFGCGVEWLSNFHLSILACQLVLLKNAKLYGKQLYGTNCAKVPQRLAKWMSKLLSRGSKLALLQSTLWSLPIYFISLFTSLTSIAIRLQQIIRHFLCSRNDSSDGFYWFNWDKDCCSKQEGGHGIRHLSK